MITCRAKILFFVLAGSVAEPSGMRTEVKLKEYKHYVLLTSDVQEYYSASSVFIVYPSNDENILLTSLLMLLLREFSRKGVLSLTMSFTDVHQFYYHDRRTIDRPLFVVLLSNEDEIIAFERVTQHFDMSFPAWLVIFMIPIRKYCEFPRGNRFNLKFDTEMIVRCYGDNNLREWYSLYDNQTEIFELATWDLQNRFILNTFKPLYERRHSLGGKTLRVASVKESPFIAKEYGEISGIFTHILTELADAMNFTIDLVYKEDAYGMFDPSINAWSGVMSRLVNKEADIGVAEFTMTGQRLDAVDFTLPLMLSRNRLYMRQPDGSVVQWSAYFRIFRPDIAITFVILLVATPIFLTIVRLKIEANVPINHVSENYLNVWGIYCQQGLAEFPASASLRIAYFSLFISSLVLWAVYSASLISYITLTSPSLPFSNTREFAKDGSYKLVAFQQSSDYDMFRVSKDRVLMKMMTMMKDKEDLPKTMMGGFRQACGKNVAFYATQAVRNQISARVPCNLVYIESGRIDSLGMVLSKKNPYTGLVNHHLMKFESCGILKRFLRTNFIKITTPDSSPEAVSLMGIAPNLAVLAGGIILGIVMLTLEKMHFSWLCCSKRHQLANR